ncbi:MAG: hypothetical protein KC583_09680 [Myxococcales bacterium]|nr:hypothetical protein [Myxococcales bacterium]
MGGLIDFWMDCPPWLRWTAALGLFGLAMAEVLPGRLHTMAFLSGSVLLAFNLLFGGRD